jgi:REP element-mobilizing transposase RayT
MGHPIRHYQPGVHTYEVIAKCCGDEMLMRPSPMGVALMALALSEACKEHPCIRVVAFTFLSNHYHLLLQVADDRDAPRISAFLKTLNQTLARTLNALLGRRGHFFRGKPHITAVLDDAAVADRMTYSHAQAVHHGLVERCEEWIGLSSFRAVCDGKPCLEVPHFDEAAWREAGARDSEIADFTKVVTIPLSKPLKWERLSPSELEAARRAHEESVRDRERDKRAERASGGRRSLPKPSSYATVDPFSRPAGPVEHKPRPWAHGSKEAVAAYRGSYSDTLASYRVASAKFRKTRKVGVFPTGTFAPWAWGMRTVR